MTNQAIFRQCKTVNNETIDLFAGDKVSAIGGNGRHYSGIVGEKTTMTWRRDIIQDADLSSNYYRISKLNGERFGQ